MSTHITPTILDGKKVRDELKRELIAHVQKLSQSSHKGKPCLAIIQVGHRPDSTVYVGAKKKFAAEVGITERHLHLPENVVQEILLQIIDKLNSDSSIHGILVQLPLPESLNKDLILNAIVPHKDVDGLSAENIKKWSRAATEGQTSTDVIWPATTRGIRELLQFYKIPLKGKKVAIIGRSLLVGQPTAAMCRAEGAHVTVCHRQTKDLIHETQQADILIVAAGSPGLIGAKHVRADQIIIDVGMTKNLKTGKLQGDVDFHAVLPIIGANGFITPVPGGVGVMTVLALFENVIDAYVATA